MLSYGTASEIAAKVFADLNIDDNIYLSWSSDNEVIAFENEYLNEDFIRPLVEAELQNYDTSENQKPSKKPFLKNQKLKELNTKVFKLKYDPQDIMINFERKKLFKCTFC